MIDAERIALDVIAEEVSLLLARARGAMMSFKHTRQQMADIAATMERLVADGERIERMVAEMEPAR